MSRLNIWNGVVTPMLEKNSLINRHYYRVKNLSPVAFCLGREMRRWQGGGVEKGFVV